MPNNETQANNWQAAIADALQTHPGVREVTIVDDGCDGIAAFVVPNDSYVDDVLGLGAAETTAIGKWRKASDLSQLTKEATFTPVGFNTIGWDSSYTRQPIPDVEMREWVATTVASILQFAPKTVYEIGCGTGMLLMRIAPQCDRYVAVDFSPVVLGKLREQLLTVPSVAKQVEIVERTADNFEGIEENSFDTVVLNSIVQYFPSAGYLSKVLEKAVHVVKPDGVVFVGDVRNLTLLSSFASSVELIQATDEVSVEILRNRIRRRIGREQELVISPAYFMSLLSRFKKLSRVEIQPRLGRADNEMTRYRYNAILHVGRKTEASCNDEFLDWEEHRWTLDGICSVLRRHPTAPLGIKRIQNSRIEKDLEALAILGVADATQTTGDLRHALKQNQEKGIHPQALIDLEMAGFGFAVFLSWASCQLDGSYDAYFIPTASFHGEMIPAIGWPSLEPSGLVRLTNAPGQGKLRNELIQQLKTHCNQTLSEGMAPREIMLVDALARTADGDVDSVALLASARNATV